MVRIPVAPSVPSLARSPGSRGRSSSFTVCVLAMSAALAGACVQSDPSIPGLSGGAGTTGAAGTGSGTAGAGRILAAVGPYATPISAGGSMPNPTSTPKQTDKAASPHAGWLTRAQVAAELGYGSIFPIRKMEGRELHP